MNSTRPPWPYQTKLVVSLLVLGFLIYMLFRFSVVIAPIVLAIILAYIISPLATLFTNRLHLPKVLSILLAYIVLLFLVGLIPVLALPILITEIQETDLSLKTVLASAQGLLVSPIHVAGISIDLTRFVTQANDAIRGLSQAFVSQTLTLVVDVITSIVWVIFIFVFSFYLVKDSDKLRSWVEDRVPPVYRSDFIRLRDQINGIWSAFFRGQIVLATVVAIMFTVIGLVLGIPFAIGMGVLAGILEFLPSVGHGIWMVIAASLAFFIGSTWLPLPNWVFAMLIIGLHMVFQQFDLNYLIPRIIGRRVHLPPIVVILGIVSGAVLAGILGIPLAAPTIASARVIGRYIYSNIFDLEPFPAEEEPSTLAANPKWWRHPAKERIR
jgi:predicted PurR-regulated permease PerM